MLRRAHLLNTDPATRDDKICEASQLAVRPWPWLDPCQPLHSLSRDFKFLFSFLRNVSAADITIYGYPCFLNPTNHYILDTESPFEWFGIFIQSSTNINPLPQQSSSPAAQGFRGKFSIICMAHRGPAQVPGPDYPDRAVNSGPDGVRSGRIAGR